MPAFQSLPSSPKASRFQLMSNAMQGVARTTAEEKRKRATMVGNDGVNILTKAKGRWWGWWKGDVKLGLDSNVAMIFLDFS